jgi:hypothetical protein
VLERSSERLCRQVEHDLCPAYTRAEIRDDRPDMAFVEAPEIVRVSAPEHGCVLSVSHPHILIYEPATTL